MSKIDYSAVRYVDFERRRVETLQERIDRLPTFREKLEALPPGCKLTSITLPPRRAPAEKHHPAYGSPENPARFERLEDVPPGSKIRSITVPPQEPPVKPAPELGSTFDGGPRLSGSRARRHGRFTDNGWD